MKETYQQNLYSTTNSLFMKKKKIQYPSNKSDAYFLQSIYIQSPKNLNDQTLQNTNSILIKETQSEKQSIKQNSTQKNEQNVKFLRTNVDQDPNTQESSQQTINLPKIDLQKINYSQNDPNKTLNQSNNMSKSHEYFLSYRHINNTDQNWNQIFEKPLNSSDNFRNLEYIQKQKQLQKDAYIDATKDKSKNLESELLRTQDSYLRVLAKNKVKAINLDKQDARIRLLEKQQALNNRQKNVKFYWYKQKVEGNIPPSSFGSTFNNIKNKFYLIGGLSQKITNDVYILGNSDMKWEKVVQQQNNPMEPRYHHTTCVYGDKLIVFGGCTSQNQVTKQKNCFNDILIFDVNTNKWKTYDILNQDEVVPRRNHAAQLIGKFLIICGGINEQGEYLNDSWYLNLQTNRWTQLTHVNLPQIAFHTMNSVFKVENPNFFKLEQTQEYQEGAILNERIQQEGLYIFGGKDHQFHERNQISVLIVGVKKIFIKNPNVKGSPPQPRFGHSTCYFKKYSYLIIHGGRNDSLNEIFNDTWILDLEQLVWIQVEFWGNTQLSLYGHSAFIHAKHMIVFGGLNEKSIYTDPIIWTMEMDKVLARTRAKNESNITNKVDIPLTHLEQQQRKQKIRQAVFKIIYKGILQKDNSAMIKQVFEKYTSVPSFKANPSTQELKQHLYNYEKKKPLQKRFVDFQSVLNCMSMYKKTVNNIRQEFIEESKYNPNINLNARSYIKSTI